MLGAAAELLEMVHLEPVDLFPLPSFNSRLLVRMVANHVAHMGSPGNSSLEGVVAPSDIRMKRKFSTRTCCFTAQKEGGRFPAKRNTELSS